MLDETPRADTTSDDTTSEDTDTTLPEILEVFGAEPLTETGTDEAPTDLTPTASTPATEATDADRFAALEQAVGRLERQASFLPPKLRGLGERVDALASVLAHARTRTLLTEVVALDDLVRNGLTELDAGDEAAPARVLQALAATLSTLLEGQGVEEIGTDGDFDPTRHQAVRQLPVDEAQYDGAVLEVDRRGFAHGEQVLRFAEVAVGRHTTTDTDTDTTAEPTADTNEEESED
jgi:molecular chaperone GrpE